MARGNSHKKEKCKLGGPTFYRCFDVITLPLLHLLLHVRLFSGLSRTVFAELDQSRSKNSFSQNSTVFAGLDIILLVV